MAEAGEIKNGVHHLKMGAGQTVHTAGQNKDPSLWHIRLGHPSSSSLNGLSVYFGFQLNKTPLCVVIFVIEQNKLKVFFLLVNPK